MVSICEECQYRRVITSVAHGAMDCDPDDEICEREMYENFGTQGGCYKYEEWEDYYDD